MPFSGYEFRQFRERWARFAKLHALGADVDTSRLIATIEALYIKLGCDVDGRKA